MKSTLKIISFLGLCLTIVPSILVLKDKIDLDLHKTLMIIGTFLWFVTAPFWMKSKSLEEQTE